MKVTFLDGKHGGCVEIILTNGAREIIPIDFYKQLLNQINDMMKVGKTTKKKIENLKIKIPLTDDDLQELQIGETKNWTFPVEGSANREWVEVELTNSNEIEEEEEE